VGVHSRAAVPRGGVHRGGVLLLEWHKKKLVIRVF